MSDFDHDLYGDLDLEDLDATQLDEELVDPDAEPSSVEASTLPDVKPPTSSYAPAPETGAGGHRSSFGEGGSRGPPPQDQHGDRNFDQDQSYMDRIKPSDMPDEGLVIVSFPRVHPAFPLSHRRLVS